MGPSVPSCRGWFNRSGFALRSGCWARWTNRGRVIDGRVTLRGYALTARIIRHCGAGSPSGRQTAAGLAGGRSAPIARPPIAWSCRSSKPGLLPWTNGSHWRSKASWQPRVTNWRLRATIGLVGGQALSTGLCTGHRPCLSYAELHPPFQLRLQRGIEVYLWNLAVALVHQGIQVDILTWQGPLEIPAYARVPGIRLRRVPAVRYFQAYIAVFYYLFWLLCGRYHHLFVHFACYGEGPALCLARLFRRLPFSVVFHFPPSLVPHQYRAFTCWGFQRAARHLVAVSRATSDEVQAWGSNLCGDWPRC